VRIDQRDLSKPNELKFKVATLNAHSIGNKSAYFNTFIVDRHTDILAIVETWHDGIDSPDLIACTPQNYKYVEKSRRRLANSDVSIKGNHGGICVFMRSEFKVSEITLPEYSSMEVLALSIRSSRFCPSVLVVYRPGSVPVTNFFIEEFADAVERCSSRRNLIIVGDVNIHLDCSSINATVEFKAQLDAFGLKDNVHQPTHLHNQQLDVFITRSDEPIPIVTVDPPIISDHSLIIATYRFLHSNTQQPRPRFPRRKWRSLDIDKFTTDLIESRLLCDPPDDVNDYFECYDKTLAELLNIHAPIVWVRQYARPASPWFDTECHFDEGQNQKVRKEIPSS